MKYPTKADAIAYALAKLIGADTYATGAACDLLEECYNLKSIQAILIECLLFEAELKDTDIFTGEAFIDLQVINPRSTQDNAKTNSHRPSRVA